MCTLDKSNNHLKFGGTHPPVNPFRMEDTMYGYGSPFGPQQSPLQQMKETIDFWKTVEKEIKDSAKKPEPSKKKDKWLEIAQTFVVMSAFAPIAGLGQLALYLLLFHYIKGIQI